MFNAQTAIRTRYKNGRITADDGAGHRASVQYDDALTSEANHKAAAQALADQDSTGRYAGGGVWHWRGYQFGGEQIWVLVPGNGF